MQEHQKVLSNLVGQAPNYVAEAVQLVNNIQLQKDFARLASLYAVGKLREEGHILSSYKSMADELFLAQTSTDEHLEDTHSYNAFYGHMAKFARKVFQAAASCAG